MKAVIVNQTTKRTEVKCPECKRTISVYHDNVGRPNDGFGRLNIGEQNVNFVVCMNKMSDGKYCRFAGSMSMVER